MCIELVNLSFKQKNLSSSEHSILNVLCFRADSIKQECWPSSKSLEESTSLNEKTISKCISSLIEKGLIIKTGQMKGKTKRVTVYKINIPKNGCVQNLNTPNFSVNTPKNGGVKCPQKRVLERSVLKVKEKEVFSLSKEENKKRYSEFGAKSIGNLLKTLSIG